MKTKLLSQNQYFILAISILTIGAANAQIMDCVEWAPPGATWDYFFSIGVNR